MILACCRLFRPKSMNALCMALCEELVAALETLDKDSSVRAIVLTGNEKAFAAGADIKEMSSKNYATVAAEDMFRKYKAIESIRKPIIAAVNGYALGGGCEIAMMCDIILAGDKAKFGQPEILIGTIPGMGGTQRLTRAVGKSRAMEWILTGRHITAKEAADAGLVSRVVESSNLEEEALKLAETIASHSQPAIISAKECVNRAFESSLQEGLLYELRAFHSTFASEDRLEGMSAFVEKRPPAWRH
ncbi:enoyl-CoA hydratase/isomerase family protein, partial [Cardiosporidium cionae]